MTKEPLLSIRNLHAGTEEHTILRGVNLEIPHGEMHALMGPNGSGKSTLAYVLAGHPEFQVFQGEVRLEGKNLLELSPEERAHYGLFLAFQHPVELPGVSMIEFLRTAVNETRAAQGKEPIPTTELLKQIRTLARELLGSDDYISRNVNEGFSGGERKRNEILQMLLLQPKMIILDETDSGLDIDGLKLIARAVERLRDDQRGFLVITHYYRILEFLKPDRVHLLVDGKIVTSGTYELAVEVERRGYEAILQDLGALTESE